MNTLFEILFKTLVSFALFCPFLYACYKLEGYNYRWYAVALYTAGMAISMVIAHKYVQYLKNK